MKRALLIVVLLAGLATPAASGASTARLTIPKLDIWNMPIYNSPDQIDLGPYWHYKEGPRPGAGKYMIVGGHDVTPVRGYGNHGPFYHLVKLRKGDLVMVRWRGYVYTYRIVGKPRFQYESSSEILDRGVEAIWLYTCWPRYTSLGRLWGEGQLVSRRALGSRA